LRSPDLPPINSFLCEGEESSQIAQQSRDHGVSLPMSNISNRISEMTEKVHYKKPVKGHRWKTGLSMVARDVHEIMTYLRKGKRINP
jgi:hypothetical protein